MEGSDKTEEETKKEEETKAQEGEESTPVKTVGVHPEWKQFNTDLDSALEKMALDSTQTQSQELNKDLLTLGFDPFASPQKGDAFAPNGSVLSTDPFQTNPGDTSAVAHPPLTVSNLSTSLPDFPDGVEASTANVPPAHLAYMSRPRPMAGSQQVWSAMM